MKKLIAVIGLLAMLGLVGGRALAAHPGGAAHKMNPKNVKVLLYIGGSLGDLGFNDSANRGVVRAGKKLGVQIKVVPQANSSEWTSQMLSLVQTNHYNLVIADTSDVGMNAAVKNLLQHYPNQKVIEYDDESFHTRKNVSTILYAQNEGSFLAGALSAMVADSHLKYTTGKKVLGLVGGQNIQVINDFVVGYKQGAKTVDRKMQVHVAYIGGSGGNDTWSNKPAGARLARSLYNLGASVVYQVAGGSGLGVLSESKSMNRYAVGVDSNQDAIAPGHVIGSVVKRVDNSLFDSIKLYLNGKLKGNHIYWYGIANHGVSLTRDKYTNAIIPGSMYKRLNRIAAKVTAGKIKVKSTFKH